MTDANLPNALSGQRTLAAIVFTDVVNFSGLVQQSEEHTLGLVQRDLAGIRAIAADHEGQVLKSTGDGLLIFFNSAVQAVSCSLEIQRWLTSQAASLAPDHILQHRIGIHLGDVFVSETDVMGDGVNIAARLQSEAEPGGICISQTVYDVVKNQLGIKTTCLGPRDLKNIRQSVPVYRILMDAHAVGASDRKTRNRSILIATLTGVFAALALIIIVTQIKRRNAQRQQPPQVVQQQPQPLPPQAQLTTTPADVQPTTPDGEKSDLLRRYEFGRLAKHVRELTSGGKVPAGTNPPQHYEELAGLWTWTTHAIASHTETNPLAVSPMPLAGENFEVWGVGDGKLAVRRNGQVSHVSATNMPSATMGLVVLTLIEQSGEPPAKKQQLFGVFLKFAREYRLDPTLIDARVAPKMEKRFQRPFRGPGTRMPLGGPSSRRQQNDGAPTAQ